ncbi:CLUMA_CG007292, isoform A [Clunio marinus]|uniref:CLUMA_CG007292, isoform A n=1 Tax=Clunio marinus TaxID=568069 RepID=A0A1J1I2E3_9DIPT|nr:CLUMA_CG007292, isoform A [Clunio marinus]
MKISSVLLIICLLFSTLCVIESRPFMMSMGQAIGGAFFSIWKWIDDTPDIPQNRTTMKRAPAFASKYSISETRGKNIEPVSIK